MSQMVGWLAALLAIAAAMTAVGAGQRGDGNSSRRTSEPPPVMFTDVSKAVGLDFQPVNGASPQKVLVETMGSGGLFFDFDNDGWIDVFLVDGGSLADPRLHRRARHRLYRNQGDGTFKDVTANSGIAHGDYGMGACAADIDNDGLTDLYVTGVGSNALYRNLGGGRFRDVTKPAGVGASQWSTSCAFADFDNDGFVDLFVTRYVDASMGNHRFCGDAARNLRVYCHPLNYEPRPNVLYHNNGNGTFSDASARAGIDAFRGNGLGVVVGDYDDDGRPDVFVANDSVPNYLFHNEGQSVFKEVALFAGVAVALDGKARAGMGTDFGDYDSDGRLDLLVTNHEFESASLFRNLGKGLFAEATSESGIGPATLPFVGFGAAWFDYDNDGRLDIAIANGHVIDNTALFRTGSTHAQRRLLFHNEGNRRFGDVGRRSGSGFSTDAIGRTLTVGDIDNDGDLDILVTNNGQPAELLRNAGGNRHNALTVRTVGKRSNRDGIGARVRITVGAATQIAEVKAGSSYLGQNDTRLHFGVGGATVIDRLEVRWSSYRTDVAQNVPVNATVTMVEGEGLVKRVAFTTR